MLVPSALLRAQWYESYENGRKAVQKGQWQQAVSHLTEALNDQPDSKANKKTYGFVFIDYFPYLYRGIAYYRSGDMVNARADIEKAKNEGAVEDAQRDKEAPSLLAEYIGLLQKPAPQIAQQKPAQNPPLNPSSGALQPDLKKSDLKKSDLKKPDLKKSETVAADQKQNQKLAAAVPVHPKDITAATTHEPVRTGGASAPDTAGSALFRDAVALFNNGKIGQAKARFQTLQRIAPSYPELADYMGSIGSVENMVHQGIAAFFGGEYRDAIDKLSSSSKKGNDNPHVYAFLACSYAAEYLLAGAENGNLKREAVDAFGKVRGIDPRYELDTKLISPGIIALLTGE
jgi:tetratricopeptide (TPR) repeat protein